MIRTYYRLAKPGIVYGNLLSASAGFFLASQYQFDWLRLSAMLAGIGLVMGSGCVFNNILDREIDARMDRTKTRAIPLGAISIPSAIAYGTVLGLGGLGLLFAYTNQLTFLLAAAGLAIYAFVYTPLKKRTPIATLVGSVSGAVPPLVGYCSVSNKLDLPALLLFAALAFWQMPHFYAIAIFRFKDYASARVPVLPLQIGVSATKWRILWYVVAFVITASLFTFFGITGYVYLAGVIILGAVWLLKVVSDFKSVNETAWARRVFGFSLLVLVSFSALIAIGPSLP